MNMNIPYHNKRITNIRTICFSLNANGVGQSLLSHTTFLDILQVVISLLHICHVSGGESRIYLLIFTN